MTDCFECAAGCGSNGTCAPPDADDVHSLALCAWREARGEGCAGMRAVMHTIKNRVGFPGFAHTIHDVIYGKNQFTSMSVPSDPEFNLNPDATDQLFLSALTMAVHILTEQDFDITNGAHYYCNLSTSTSGWFFTNIVRNTKDHPQTAVINHHTFFL